MRSAAMYLLILLPSLCTASLTARSFDSRVFEAEEVDDQNFLAAQWRNLESDMLTLQKHLDVTSRGDGFLQLRATPAAQAKPPSTKPEPKEKPKVAEKSAVGKPKKADSKMEPSGTPAEPAVNRLAQAEGLMKGLSGAAMLAPMEAMLESMYDDQKKRIGDINKREQKSKDRFAKEKAEFDARIASIKERHDKHKLSDEFFKNETRDYTRQFKYWEGVRERNHRQFHNALKITHGMMQNEKNMISKYKAAMSMKIPQQNAAKPPAKVEEPEVTFLQQRKAVVAFIQKTLTEVRQNLAEVLTPKQASSA